MKVKIYPKFGFQQSFPQKHNLELAEDSIY